THRGGAWQWPADARLRGYPARAAGGRTDGGYDLARHGRPRERLRGTLARAAGSDRSGAAALEVLHPLGGRPRPRQALQPHLGSHGRAV
ncbi:MAG: Acetylornithine deacetylase/Succinyl-diaminopimelate desuccinylase and related deacylases, partial [uncultured Rubrobacteraceae bacterium]